MTFRVEFQSRSCSEHAAGFPQTRSPGAGLHLADMKNARYARPLNSFYSTLDVQDAHGPTPPTFSIVM